MIRNDILSLREHSRHKSGSSFAYIRNIVSPPTVLHATKEGELMPHFTYLPGPDDGETTRAFGFTFAAGEWTLIPAEDHHALAKLRANRFFQERETTESNIPLGASYPNAITDQATELHESGNDELPSACSQPVDITPQQCKAARAGLDWSREQLALAAGIAERTITDFERQASNMLRKNKVALREAFYGAGVIFDGSDGIRFGESKAA